MVDVTKPVSHEILFLNLHGDAGKFLAASPYYFAGDTGYFRIGGHDPLSYKYTISFNNRVKIYSFFANTKFANGD